MQTIARSISDTGPMGGQYMPHAPPIVGRYRMRRQLRTVHDLISSPRAFAGRATPKERLVDSTGVPAPRLTTCRRRARVIEDNLAPARGEMVTVSRWSLLLEVEGIDHISDESRAVVESEWPELAHKLPPKKPQG